MKKFFSKALFLCVTTVCLAFCIVVSASAALVPGRFYNTHRQTTAITGTYGYSSGNFTGEYYSDGSGTNIAVVSADCRGGAIDSFKTTLTMRLSDAVRVLSRLDTDSNTASSRYLEGSLTANSGAFVGRAVGYVEEVCTSKTDSRDYWQQLYTYNWVYAQAGWTEVTS
jgi:hypothetical protein